MVVENPLWGQETEIEEDACSVGYCCVFFLRLFLKLGRVTSSHVSSSS